MFEAYGVGASMSFGVPAAFAGLSNQLGGLVDGLGAAAAAITAFEIPALAVATGASVGSVPSAQGLPTPVTATPSGSSADSVSAASVDLTAAAKRVALGFDGLDKVAARLAGHLDLIAPTRPSGAAPGDMPLARARYGVSRQNALTKDNEAGEGEKKGEGLWGAFKKFSDDLGYLQAAGVIGGVLTGSTFKNFAGPVSKIPFVGKEAGLALQRTGTIVRKVFPFKRAFDAVPKSLPETGEAIGGIGRSVATWFSKLGPVFESASNAARNIVSSFGRLSGVFEKVANAVRGMFSWFGRLGQVFEQIGNPIRMIGSWFSRLGSIFDTIAETVGGFVETVGPLFEGLAAVLGPVVEVVGAVFAAIGSAPIGLIVGVVAAIVALGVGIYEMVAHWDKSKSILDNLKAEFGMFFSWIGGIAGKAVSAIANNPIARAIGRFAQFIPGVGPIMALLGQWKNIKALFSGLFSGLAKGVQAQLAELGNLKPLWDNVAKAIDGVVDWIGGLIQKGLALVSKLPHAPDVSGALKTLGQSAVNFFQGAGPRGASAITQAHQAQAQGRTPPALTPPKPAATAAALAASHAAAAVQNAADNHRRLAAATAQAAKTISAASAQAAHVVNAASKPSPHVPVVVNIAPFQVSTRINLDGRAVATAISKYQAHALSGPRGGHVRPDGNIGLHAVAGVLPV